MRSRVQWWAALLAAAATLGVVTVAVAGHHVVRRDARKASASPPASQVELARAVLRTWDRRRADAWARADPESLARLYLPTSAAGRRDRAMLAAYHHRGLRVTGMTRQVVRLRVSVVTPRRLEVVVTDRLVDARVVGARVRSAVPDGHLATRRIRLARVAGRWQVAEVTAVGGQPAR
jgi:hypothetical protein